MDLACEGEWPIIILECHRRSFITADGDAVGQTEHDRIGDIHLYLADKLAVALGTDRLIGMVFGAARGVLLVAVLVLLAGLTPMPEEDWWLESGLVGYFQELSYWLRDLLPREFADHFSYTA